MAFLHRDLIVHGRRDLADAYSGAYFRASGDEEGRAWLASCTAYHAAGRGAQELRFNRHGTSPWDSALDRRPPS